MFSSMLKRDFRLFLRCLVPAVALTLTFALICAGAAYAAAKGAGELYVPSKVAVVDGEDSILSRLAISAVKNMDYISDLMEVSQCGMEEAMSGLKTGEYAAVIILPNGFTGDISAGRYTRGKIILSTAAAFNAQTVESAARFGEVMLAAGQYGVFSGEQLIRQYELSSEFHKNFLAKVNAALFGEAVNAEDTYFDIEVTDYADTSMSVVSYYAVSWLTLVLFLCSVFFTKLYAEDLSRSMLCRLKASGVSNRSFLFGKLLFPAVFRLILLLPLLRSFTAVSFLFCLCGVIAVSVMGTSLVMCTKNGTAWTSALAVLGLFICGGIVPRQLLPHALLDFGSLTPFGAVQSLIKPLFGGEFTLLQVSLAAVYTLASLRWMLYHISAICVGGEDT